MRKISKTTIGKMTFLRSVLTALFFVLFGIGGFLMGILVIPVAMLFSREHAISALGTSWKLFVWGLEFFRLIKLEKKNLNPSRKGVVIAANHPTLLDIVFLMSSYENSICIVKGSLLHNIFLRFIVRRIFIPTKEFDVSAINKAASAIKSGINVIIFPEGTRSDNPRRKIYSGAARISLKANCPVVPVRITCDPLILGKTSNPLSVSNRTVKFALEEFPPIFPESRPDLSNARKSRLLTSKISEILKLK